MKLHESRKSDKMVHLMKGIMNKNQLDRHHRKDREREKKIKEITERLSLGEISTKQFLEMISDDKGKHLFVQDYSHFLFYF